MPIKTHDGTVFDSNVKKRKKAAGTQISKACLVELVGVWVFYKSLLRFPHHNEKAECCWRFSVTPETFRGCGKGASWRSETLDHWKLMRSMSRA